MLTVGMLKLLEGRLLTGYPYVYVRPRCMYRTGNRVQMLQCYRAGAVRTIARCLQSLRDPPPSLIMLDYFWLQQTYYADR